MLSEPTEPQRMPYLLHTGLPHKQTREGLDRHSSSMMMLGTKSHCLLMFTRRRHLHRLQHYQQRWEFTLGGNQRSCRVVHGEQSTSQRQEIQQAVCLFEKEESWISGAELELTDNGSLESPSLRCIVVITHHHLVTKPQERLWWKLIPEKNSGELDQASWHITNWCVSSRPRTGRLHRAQNITGTTRLTASLPVRLLKPISSSLHCLKKMEQNFILLFKPLFNKTALN